MKTNYSWIALLLLSFLLPVTNSYCQFKVDAQIRPRLEFRDGYQKLLSDGIVPAIFISQRSRISLSYETENFKLKFSPQDVRVWGDESNLTNSSNYGDNSSVDLFEAYAEVRLGNAGWVSIGRQQISYDNEWMMSAGSWNQNGNSNDAVIFKLTPFGMDLHLGTSWNTRTENSYNNLYPTDKYKSMSFLWLNKKLSENWTMSFLQMATGLTQTDTTNNLNFRYTSGIYTELKKGNFNFSGNAYYQYGKYKGLPVNAYLLTAELGYKISTITPGIGFAYHSGNKLTGASMKKDNLFDLIFSSRHTYFGNMDFFKTMSSNTKQGGIQDYYFNLNFKATKSVSLKNTAHYFMLAQTNSTTPADKNLGFENDLILKYKFSDWGALDCGYLLFSPTKSLETIQGVTNSKMAQFFYLQLTFTPTLFNQTPIADSE